MMLFLSNLLLALVWAAMTGSITLSALVVGFALGYFVLMPTGYVTGNTTYFQKLPQVLKFALWFAWELFKSNLQVAHDVVTPRHHSRPGVISIPLAVETPAAITMLANLITLTPGTLSLDVSDDRKVLYIHAMFIDDADSLRKDIKEGLERRIMELMQ